MEDHAQECRVRSGRWDFRIAEFIGIGIPDGTGGLIHGVEGDFPHPQPLGWVGSPSGGAHQKCQGRREEWCFEKRMHDGGMGEIRESSRPSTCGRRGEWQSG